LLVVGSLVPFQYLDAGTEEAGINLVTIFGVLVDEGDPLVFLIGFAGLLLCTLAALVIVLLQGDGRRSRNVQAVGKVVGVLMAVGALVPTLVAVLSSRSTEDMAAGPGMAFYYAGTVLFLMLMYSEELDSLGHDYMCCLDEGAGSRCDHRAHATKRVRARAERDQP